MYVFPEENTCISCSTFVTTKLKTADGGINEELVTLIMVESGILE